MTTSPRIPIACTLTGGNFRDRLAWIAELARESLQSYEQRDLVLELRYDLAAAERVREMVRKEQQCCAFLTFDLRQDARTVHLTITAPEEARGAAEMLFEQFVGSTTGSAAPNCCSRGAAGDA
jgi:hypothetical protein